MNERMWNNPATRSNVELIQSRGIRVMSVGEGELACMAEGKGRMLEPAAIMKELLAALGT